MALTGAERPRAYSERRMAGLATAVADLERRLADAPAEIERLSPANTRQRLQDGMCPACEADVW